MDPKPKVDHYPEPVALTALGLRKLQRLQTEKGRSQRLQRLARRNRDVAWLMEQVPSERTPRNAKVPKTVKPPTP